MNLLTLKWRGKKTTNFSNYENYLDRILQGWRPKELYINSVPSTKVKWILLIYELLFSLLLFCWYLAATFSCVCHAFSHSLSFLEWTLKYNFHLRCIRGKHSLPLTLQIVPLLFLFCPLGAPIWCIIFCFLISLLYIVVLFTLCFILGNFFSSIFHVTNYFCSYIWFDV